MNNPTKIRLEIAKNISNQLRNIVDGVVFGGSMGYGQNYSVTEDSDIDLVIVCSKNKVDELEKTNYFKGEIPKEVLEIFKNGRINFFWVTKIIDSVEVNCFIYEAKGYEEFCLLKGGIKGYILTKPAETQTQYKFNGKEITFKRNVTKYHKGYLYEKPALVDGIYWGGPPRMDFEYPLKILYEKDNFLTNLKHNFWKEVIKQLVKEYGKEIDFSKTGILQSNWTYQKNRERLPKEIINYIKNKQKKELERYLER